ncbi:MAG TPA: hypothetical protein VGQ76_11270, partial [Thermoanaerobaculia bacterium]|nr:hypothetical protein [Thermoanaerobaculia bacterium]
MLRRLLLCALALFVTSPVIAQSCDLSLTVACHPGANGAPSACTATTTNTGTTACTGLAYSAFYSEESPDDVHISAPHTSLQLGQCLDSSELGTFIDIAVAFCAGDMSLHPGASFTSTVQISGA